MSFWWFSDHITELVRNFKILMENLMVHPDQQELITWDWMNWSIWFIILWHFYWKILAFNICFPGKLSSYVNYDLQQVDKVYFCKQRWNIYLFLSTWSLQNFVSTASFPVDLMAYCNQITASYTNHCFNLFSLVFKLLMPCACLCCTVTLLMLQLYYLYPVYFIRLLSLALPNV